MTDEVMNERLFGALPMSYGATIASCPGGIRSTTAELWTMYSNPELGWTAGGTDAIARKGGLID